MISDGLILALIFSGVLLCLGAKMGSRPMIFISSIGWMICGLQIFQQTSEFLPTALLMMIAFGQFFLTTGARD